MKAMILSAGYGTRLKPYTETLPKALVQYRSKPMINYQIDRLKSIGVSEIVVNSHHLHEKMEEYFFKNKFDVRINLIIENEILGTGGGILNAQDFFENENYFIVINVDIQTDMDMRRMVLYNESVNPFATIAVQRRRTGRYLEFDHNMNLIGRQNEDSDRNRLFAFNGIHIISEKIFDRNLPVEFNNIIDIYLDVIKSNTDFISGYDAGESSFKDLGKIEHLLS